MRLRELEHELDAWTAEGLVSPEQAAAIRSRYAREAPAATRERVVRVISSVGAVVAGLGVVLFVAANWDGMPRPTRVVLLLALVAAAYAAGYALRERRGTHPHVGEALYLLGGLAFAAEIFLVGQMYHVDAHWPLAFLAISLLTGAVAAVVRAQALAALSLVALGVWPLAELFELDGDAGLYAPVAAALYGCALYGLGTGDRGPSTGRASARRCGRSGCRWCSSGRSCSRSRRRTHAVSASTVDGRALAALVALAVAAGVRRRRSSRCCRGRRTAPWEAAGCSRRRSSSCSRCSRRSSTRTAAPSSIRSCSTSCSRRSRSGRSWSATSRTSRPSSPVGIVAVGVDVLARYFDVFWDFLPRSIGFVGAGLLLLGLAWLLERQRSRLVGSMR